MSARRNPSESAPPRMAALARLPVFFALAGKRALVAGDGPAAAWKAELLAAAGANVDVFAPSPSEELLALAALPPAGEIVIHRRDWQAADFKDAVIAVGDCENTDEARRFRAVAHAAGIPVNVIDKQDFCDFAFGAIVNRSPLVVGISTDGAAPVFGQAIRSRIEALLPAGFARWAEAARIWRGEVKTSGLSFNGRRRFWQLFTRFAVTNPGREPARDDLKRLIDEATAEGEAVEQGSVILVGAGPGDPELLTLRAVRALQSADVILFDDLVSPEILDFARREAKRMLVGKTGYGPSCKQDDINAMMIALAKSGRRVVRLKGGDPMIFGRAGEEIAACQGAGIPVEVVPGISAAQGAASRLGVSLTHRQHARRLQYVTGHGEKGGLPADLDWRSLADPAATTVIYMPVRTLPALAEKAIEKGLDPQTPAIAISRATRPDETVISAPIRDLPARVAEQAPRGPMIVIIGRALEEYRANAGAEAAVRTDRGAVRSGS